MNICRFVPVTSTPDVITPLNYVYEAKRNSLDRPFVFSFYRVCLVTRGSAYVTSCYGRETVRENDLFFLFPAVEYQVDYSDDFCYLYISYIGIRANMIMERLSITKQKSVYKEMVQLRAVWENGVRCNEEMLDLTSESVLMYTFSAIGNRIPTLQTEQTNNASENFLLVKKYIDESFTDPELSLEQLSSKVQYNEKYLSCSFKKQFKIGINAYINMLRIDYACILINQNQKFVKNIADQCGFKDAMYFSKVFKKKVGQSPRDYIRQREQHREE